jgi:hypothetical protein
MMSMTSTRDEPQEPESLAGSPSDTAGLYALMRSWDYYPNLGLAKIQVLGAFVTLGPGTGSSRVIGAAFSGLMPLGARAGGRE